MLSQARHGCVGHVLGRWWERGGVKAREWGGTRPGVLGLVCTGPVQVGGSGGATRVRGDNNDKRVGGEEGGREWA